MEIKSIKARQILNSRGYPAVETEIILKNDIIARASVPSGASKGEKEALELIDNNPNYYDGKSVLTAIKNVNTIICNSLMNVNILEQEKIDQELIKLDGTDNKSNLGANAILSVSLAACKAAAEHLNIPLCRYFNSLITEEDNFSYYPPTPMINILNGGVHADNNLSIQEFMIVPVDFASFSDAIAESATVFHRLKKILKEKGYSTNVGDEGGFAPQLNTTHEALDLLTEAIGDNKVKIALDSAASEFHCNNEYKIDQKTLNSDALVEFYSDIVNKYDIMSIEDPCSENDITGWKKITEKLGGEILLVGDDLFVTNPKIFFSGIQNNLGNSILIKMNQIGTITETVEAIKLAKKHNYSVIISHRSAETEDVSIAHLAVACGRNAMIKAGSLARSERVTKYNEILRIEENFRK